MAEIDVAFLRSKVEELEFERDEISRRPLMALISARYGLTRQESAFIACLLDGRVKTFDNLAVVMETNADDTDGLINVKRAYIRRKCPWMDIKSIRFFGYQMSKETAQRIKAEIADF